MQQWTKKYLTHNQTKQTQTTQNTTKKVAPLKPPQPHKQKTNIQENSAPQWAETLPELLG